MRNVGALAIVATVVLTCPIASPAQTPTNYTASWASVDLPTPAPEWFKDAGFAAYQDLAAAVQQLAKEKMPR